MKKVLAVVLALAVGLLANAAICVVGVFLWAIAFAGYLILGLIPMCAYAAFLEFLAKMPIVKHAVSPKNFFLCAQAPSVVIALAHLIINIRKYGSADISRLFPSLSVIGAPQNDAVIMFVTVALTTASVFITAHFQRKEKRT